MLPPSGCADFRVGSFAAAWELSGPRAAAVASTRSYTRLGLLVRALGAVHAFELNPAGVERLVRGERRPIGFSDLLAACTDGFGESCQTLESSFSTVSKPIPPSLPRISQRSGKLKMR